MANEMRGISVCGECANYNWKKHKCTVCSCKESNPRNPFYDDCPLPKCVEVVRCKDCKHYNGRLCAFHSTCPDQYSPGHDAYMEPDDFCSYGEIKSGTQSQRENV